MNHAGNRRPNASSPGQLLRFASAIAMAVLAPLTMATGCPFAADEYRPRCAKDSDCSDGKTCTEDKCTAGYCENPPKPKGTGCGKELDSVCDGDGKCTECLADADCAANHPTTPICDTDTQTCVSCFDGIKNGKETHLDCGGPDCGACLAQPCDPQNGCGNHSICAAADNICCDTACADKCEACVGAKTGEPDGTCAPIPSGTDPDGECATAGGCGATPGKCRCQDGVKNGDESDVDCGGTTCGGCSGGKMCGGNGDCAADVAYCTAAKTCCGAPCDTPCSVCDPGGQCVAAVGQSDTSCGPNHVCGAFGFGCVGVAGAPCSTNAKCLSALCTAGTCAKSTVGKPCNTTADCATGTCQSYICQ